MISSNVLAHCYYIYLSFNCYASLFVIASCRCRFHLSIDVRSRSILVSVSFFLCMDHYLMCENVVLVCSFTLTLCNKILCFVFACVTGWSSCRMNSILSSKHCCLLSSPSRIHGSICRRRKENTTRNTRRECL